MRSRAPAGDRERTVIVELVREIAVFIGPKPFFHVAVGQPCVILRVIRELRKIFEAHSNAGLERVCLRGLLYRQRLEPCVSDVIFYGRRRLSCVISAVALSLEERRAERIAGREKSTTRTRRNLPR